MNIIVSIVSEYGWFVGLFLLVGFALFKFIVANYKKWSSTKTESEELDELNAEIALNQEAALKHHPFFSNAEYRIAVEIPNLELITEKPTRERVFKDLLQIAFRIVYDSARELVGHKDLNTWTSEQWVHVVTQAINQIVIDTEEKARTEGIPEIVIRKFLKWHVESIESLHEYILLLGNSKIYNTNIAKTNTMLLIMNLLLVTILGDAERVLRELNGEIKGLKYKNVTIE